MDEFRVQFSAKFDGFAAGPPNAAPLRAVRDLIVCATGDGSADVDPDEFERHPPIAFPFIGWEEKSGEPMDLGRGLRIDRLSNEEQALVMNACAPRGHYFAPVRQFGQEYSFVRDVDLATYEEHPFRWDEEGTLWDALSLSRLIRDNGFSTEFAARIVDYEDGEQMVVYTLTAESKIAYRLRRDREWLDPDEGIELRDLLAAYWAAGELPRRVSRAMWRAEYASWLKWGDLVVSMLAGGLEALLKTERHGSTRQFVARVPALAADVGVDGVHGALCERMYDARSEWVHGAHVRLFATGPTADEEARREDNEAGPQTDDQMAAFTEIARLQDVLRAAVRRCIEDQDFRAIFTDDDRIRSRWPL